MLPDALGGICEKLGGHLGIETSIHLYFQYKLFMWNSEGETQEIFGLDLSHFV
jgi:hypothetical protein